jgi:hypothetical protein
MVSGLLSTMISCHKASETAAQLVWNSPTALVVEPVSISNWMDEAGRFRSWGKTVSRDSIVSYEGAVVDREVLVTMTAPTRRTAGAKAGAKAAQNREGRDTDEPAPWPMGDGCLSGEQHEPSIEHVHCQMRREVANARKVMCGRLRGIGRRCRRLRGFVVLRGLVVFRWRGGPGALVLFGDLGVAGQRHLVDEGMIDGRERRPFAWEDAETVAGTVPKLGEEKDL